MTSVESESTRPVVDRPVIDESLVRRLVDKQFPQWSHLPLRKVDPGGSDHVIYRLGEELTVRLPRHTGAIRQAEKELYWLPRLAPHLPLAIPVPVAVGEPDLGYPWKWAVARWLEGETATVEGLGDSVEAAVLLAEFLRALQRFAPPVVPEESAGHALTGHALSMRDEATRANIAELEGVFNAAALSELWEAALAAPAWGRPPVWFHGDFHTGNLLTVNGRLHAVLDFGGFGLGDPACDMMIAFTLMSRRTRAAFREALEVDDDTWMRGRGWALSAGLNAYTSYAAVKPHIAAQTAFQITEALVG